APPSHPTSSQLSSFRPPAAHRALHSFPTRRSSDLPSIAAAAAISGLTKCVLAPFPCLPSKLRFDVDAQRPPEGTISSFIPKHILHPASRHSNPASLNTLSMPFSSASIFTKNDPGTTIAFTPSFTRLPATIWAAFSKSDKREFVHEPINT